MRDDIILDGGPGELVDDGVYDARLLHWETFYYFRVPKVNLSFLLLEPGAAFEKRVNGYFTVASLVGKPRRQGAFKVKSRQKLTTQLLRLQGKNARWDRLSLRPLLKVLLRVRVETVTTDWGQQEKVACERYSEVAELIEVKAGSLEAAS